MNLQRPKDNIIDLDDGELKVALNEKPRDSFIKRRDTSKDQLAVPDREENVKNVDIHFHEVDSSISEKNPMYKCLPIYHRHITNSIGAVNCICVLLIWGVFMAAIPFLSSTHIIGHHTDAFGRVCGVGLMKHRPFLLVFKVTDCVFLKNSLCLKKSTCVSECPTYGTCNSNEIREKYCFLASIPADHKYCPEFAMASYSDYSGLCRPQIDHKYHNSCYTQNNDLEKIIKKHSYYAKILNLNSRVAIEATQLIYSPRVTGYAVAILLFSIGITFCTLFSAMCNIAIIVVLSIVAVGLHGLSFYFKWMYYISHLTYTELGFLLVSIYASFRACLLGIKIYKHRDNLDNIFSAVRYALRKCKICYLYVPVVGMVIIALYVVSLNTCAYILTIVKPVYIRLNELSVDISLTTTEYIKCRPDEEDCYFHHYKITPSAIICFLVHLMFFFVIVKLFSTVLYFVISTKICSWYYKWKQTPSGFSHVTFIAVTRAFSYHLGTVFESCMRQTFSYFTRFVNSFHQFTRNKDFMYPTEWWYLTETVLFGISYPSAIYHAYNRKIRLMDKMMHYNTFYLDTCWYMSVLAALIATDVYDINFRDENYDGLELLVSVFVVSYMLFMLSFQLNQAVLDSLYACALHDLDNMDAIKLDLATRPSIAWPFVAIE